MHAVVLDRLSGDPGAMAQALARLLGKTAYECRPMVTVAGGGPVVMSCHADPALAETQAGQARALGFDAAVVPGSAGSSVRARMARSFVLGEAALGVVTQGSELTIDYGRVDLIVRGSQLEQHSQAKTSTTRKLDVGRAVVTGGLMMTRKHKSKRTVTTTDSHGFLVLFAGSEPPLTLDERSLLYQSLGAAMQPSRMANFTYLTGELRRACTNAHWDERLMRRITQQQILGPALRPEEHLDLAIALVAASARHR